MPRALDVYSFCQPIPDDEVVCFTPDVIGATLILQNLSQNKEIYLWLGPVPILDGSVDYTGGLPPGGTPTVFATNGALPDDCHIWTEAEKTQAQTLMREYGFVLGPGDVLEPLQVSAQNHYALASTTGSGSVALLSGVT